MKLATRYLFIAILIVFVSSTFLAEGIHAADKPRGNGPSRVYLPGTSNQERWDFLQSHLKQLSESEKSQVQELLGRGLVSAKDSGSKTETWSYRITDSQKDDAFLEVFCQLNVQFSENNVLSVEVRHVRKNQSQLR